MTQNQRSQFEPQRSYARLVEIPAGGIVLEGSLAVPAGAQGIVVFAHGSGSSRHSPRNRFVAQELNRARLATLLIDLLTAEEEAHEDTGTAMKRFDIDLLAGRLSAASDWLSRQGETAGLRLGYFGASTGAAAALVAAAEQADRIRAVVSRGGRPDLAGPALPRGQAPTLLIVGGKDTPVIAMNQEAMAQLASAEKELVVVKGASHLFEEDGALEEVARLAGDWFGRHLAAGPES